MFSIFSVIEGLIFAFLVFSILPILIGVEVGIIASITLPLTLINLPLVYSIPVLGLAVGFISAVL